MAAGVPPPHCLLPGTNGWAAVCSLKLVGHQSSGVLIFLPSIDVSLLEWKKKDVSRAFEKKKNGWLLKTFCKGGKIARKRDLGGGWRAVNAPLSRGSLSWNLVQALVVQFKLSSLVLAGFSALGPEPQQIGAYVPIHTRPWKLINKLISYTIHRRPLTKGVPATWRGKRKKL